MAKYDNIKFTAPETVKNNYKRGLEKHEEGLSGDGLESGTVEVAKDIVAGESITPEWARKGNRWWGRNERFLDEDPDSPAYVAALLWGGSAGKDWFDSLVSQMAEADKKDTASNTFVAVTNAVDKNRIRVEQEGGDEIIIIPSYTLPDDVVMNGGLYPADEIEKSYNTLEGTPAPLDHPTNENGEFVSASSEIGVHNFQCGVFNGKVVRDKGRVYVEKRLNKRVAMQTERGKRVLEAVEAFMRGEGEPLHTSTGIFLEPQELKKPQVANNGKEYTWIARNMIFDHDCILLDAPGAATPEDGVGMMVNKQRQLHVNLDDSMQELEMELYRVVHEEFSDPDNLEHAYVADWNHEELVYTVGGDSYRIGWMRTDDGEIQFVGESQPVKRRTLWEAVKNLFARSGQTSYNQSQRGRGGRVLDTLNRGDEMALRQKLIDKLKANKVELDYEKVTDEQLLEAVDNLTATNTADNEPEEPEGEVEANDAVVSAINSALKPLQDEVKSLREQMNAEKEADMKAMKSYMKENGDYTDEELDDMGEKALRNAYKRMKGNSQEAPAWHFAPNTEFKGNAADEFSTELPE